MTLDRVHLFLPGTCTTEDVVIELDLTLNTVRHSQEKRESRTQTNWKSDARLRLT